MACDPKGKAILTYRHTLESLSLTEEDGALSTCPPDHT